MEFILKDNGIYLGCFRDLDYFNRNNQKIKYFDQRNMTPEFCFDKCKEQNYLYSILKNR